MLPSDELAPSPANAPDAIAPAPNAPAVTDDDVPGPAGDAFSITFGLPSPPAPRPYSFRPDFRVLADHQVWDAAATAATKLIPWPRRAPPSVLHLDWLPPAAPGTSRPDALGEAHGPHVRLRRATPDPDDPTAAPLRDAFRAGHELAHFLFAARYGPDFPLWLDEGLAQLVGYRAAETYARRNHLTTHRTPPPDWTNAVYTLSGLTALADYPEAPAAVAAFYWQSALLVRALHARLGPDAFDAYLHALAAQNPPCADWTAPLRATYYFNPDDLDWFAQQILPSPPPSPHYASPWVL